VNEFAHIKNDFLTGGYTLKPKLITKKKTETACYQQKGYRVQVFSTAPFNIGEGRFPGPQGQLPYEQKDALIGVQKSMHRFVQHMFYIQPVRMRQLSASLAERSGCRQCRSACFTIHKQLITIQDSQYTGNSSSCQ
jgi:hypothetical protein